MSIRQQAIISTNVYPNTPRHNEIDPPIIENVDIYMFVNMCVWIWLQMNMKSKDKQLIEAEWRIYAASLVKIMAYCLISAKPLSWTMQVHF